MKFKYGTRRRALEYEKSILEFWKKNKTFEKSIESRPADDSYVFYDGPPFITGVPHHGTLLSSIVKDAIPRYQTMKGKRVERRWGWDCHGLPAENFVEKKLGITDRRDIGTKISLADYVTTARESMVQTSSLWEDTIDRIGRWVDFKGAYKTMDKDYMESVWWAFKQLYEKGKIYEGEKVLMYDTKFATPVSKNEVTMDNDAYQTVTDPSVYVKFHLLPNQEYAGGKYKTKDHVYVLAWTTTPWTLPANTALAVNSDINYAALRLDGKKELFIVAADLVDTIFKGQQVEIVHNDIKGTDLVGLKYKPLFTFYSSKLLFETYDKKMDESEIEELCARDAVRGVILDNDNRVALLHSREHGYYGIPGGGTEDGESKLAAIIREVKEETGYNFEVNGVVGKSIEYISRKHVKSTSYGFYGRINGDKNETNFTEDELGEDFVTVWADSIDDAIQLIKNGKDPKRGRSTGRDIAGRDIAFLEATKQALVLGEKEKAHQIYSADYVTTESGTGIVHLAPIYGETDFELAEKEGIPKIHVIDDNGYYYPEVSEELHKIGVRDTDETGIEVWAANKFIAKCLEEQGIVWKIDYIRHEYPFNPRSKQRIMYRAIPSWFFDIKGSKPLMLDQNENINWFPDHLKHGRFAKNIEQAPDWNLSRDRFWATAMPVWKGDKGTVKVIGSYSELKELSGIELEDYHRPWVDDIEFDIDDEHFKRIDKVLDCWFESGSMPFAQFHYPFENVEKFESNFPGDFIVEYIGQVRAWFYYVHAVNTALFGKNAFKNVITTGVVAGNDGRKMSKSYGNYTDPNELMDKFSADSLRFLLLSSPLLSGEDFALQDKDVSDVARKLSMVWNMYDFFTMYAEVDNWEFKGQYLSLKDLKNPLDIWIVSRLHQLNAEITKNMDAYNLPDAMSPILPFIDDASNWYVRRSRRRFWKSEDDSDKNDAYATLHYVLTRLAVLLAPFTPFLSEELYQKMTGDESVHLLDWPTDTSINKKVLDDMQLTRDIITEGLAIRMKRSESEDQIKVRQPLARLVYVAPEKLNDFYENIIAEEVNVKQVIHATEIVDISDGDNRFAYSSLGQSSDKVLLDKKLTPELKQEGFVRELIRFIQNARKKAGLNIDDRINLSLSCATIENLPPELQDLIKTETLAVTITKDNYAYDEIVKIDDQNITISLEKAN